MDKNIAMISYEKSRAGAPWRNKNYYVKTTYYKDGRVEVNQINMPIRITFKEATILY